MPDKQHRFPFTEAKLAKLRPPETGRETWYDSKCTGLILRKSSTGAAAYYLYRWHDGAPRRIHLGEYPTLTLTAARDATAVELGKWASGQTPTRKGSSATRMTLGELWTHYLDAHAKPRKRSWREDEKRYKRHLEAWRTRRLSAITAGDVQGLHNRVGQQSGIYEANRLRSLLHKMFAIARRDLGFKGENPVSAVEKFKEQSRERFIQSAEMPKFLAAVQSLRITNPTAADAVAVALWTGARRGNVLTMRWDELALDGGTWSVPGAKMKNGQPLTIHLPAPALEILTRRQQGATSEWVFPGRRHGKPLSDPTKPWKKILDSAGLKDLRLHDLRRTLGSWQAATGASLPVIGKSLGHLNQGTTAIYARLNLDPVRDSVNRAVEAMKATAADASESKEGNSNG